MENNTPLNYKLPLHFKQVVSFTVFLGNNYT